MVVFNEIRQPMCKAKCSSCSHLAGSSETTSICSQANKGKEGRLSSSASSNDITASKSKATSISCLQASRMFLEDSREGNGAGEKVETCFPPNDFINANCQVYATYNDLKPLPTQMSNNRQCALNYVNGSSTSRDTPLCVKSLEEHNNPDAVPKIGNHPLSAFSSLRTSGLRLIKETTFTTPSSTAVQNTDKDGTKTRANGFKRCASATTMWKTGSLNRASRGKVLRANGYTPSSNIGRSTENKSEMSFDDVCCSDLTNVQNRPTDLRIPKTSQTFFEQPFYLPQTNQLIQSNQHLYECPLSNNKLKRGVRKERGLRRNAPTRKTQRRQPKRIIHSKARRHSAILAKTLPYKPKVTLMRKRIPDNFYSALFTMIFCCFPLGLAALVYSFKVRKYSTSNRDMALKSSLRGRKLANTGVMLGITTIAYAFVYLYIKSNILFAPVEYEYYLPDDMLG